MKLIVDRIEEDIAVCYASDDDRARHCSSAPARRDACGQPSPRVVRARPRSGLNEKPSRPLPSTRCRIRLVSKQNPLVRDVTNCDFTITGRP
jgi:hypothetical protein